MVGSINQSLNIFNVFKESFMLQIKTCLICSLEIQNTVITEIAKLWLLLPFYLFHFSEMKDINIKMKEIRTTGLIPFHQ